MLRCLSLPHSRIFSGRGIQATRPTDAIELVVSIRRYSVSDSSKIPCQSRRNRVVAVASSDKLRMPCSAALSTALSTASHLRVDRRSPHVASYALCTLRDFVIVLASGSTPVHTSGAIKSLYHVVKGQSELHLLSDSDFSTLISFYGSLSVLSVPGEETENWDSSSTFYLHHAASMYGPGSHWSFMVNLAYDMKACGRSPSIQVRFWLMRAALAHAMVLSRQQPTAEHAHDFHRIMSYARREYHYVRDVTYESNVHVPWLSALLAFGTAPSLNEALFNCARIIRRAPEIDARLQAIIWRIVSASGTLASSEMRHEFCVALRRRLDVGSRQSQHQACLTRPDSPSARTGKVDRSTSADDYLDLAAFHTCLTTAVFSDSPTPRGAHFLHRWAMREVREFVSADVISLWRHLSLPALAHSLGIGSADRSPLTPLKSTGELRTWSLASALLLLQGTHWSETDAQSLHDGAQILRTLWQAWQALGTSRRRKRTPLAVERILWLAFIRTAGILQDTDMLSEMCTVEPFKSRLEDATSLFSVSLREAASVTIAAAAAACGARTWNAVLYHLENAQIWHEELALRKVVADTFIRGWAEPGREVDVAFKLYSDATPFELVSADVIRVVAKACLRDGLVREAFTCLCDPTFLGGPKAELMDTLLGQLRARGVHELPGDMANTLGNAMRDVADSHVQLIHSRSWEWTISALNRSECASLAMNVALVVAERHPQLCSRRWWTTFVHQLCNQRLFSSALRLVRDMPESHNARRAMGLTLVRRLGNASATRLAWQAWNLLSPGRVPARITLLKNVGFQGSAPVLQDTRSIIPFLFPSGQARHVGSKAYTLALYLLARSNRRRAAQRLYKQIQSGEFDPAIKTHAANAFLSASLALSRRRNARQIRHLVKVLNRLVAEDDIIPDRVTLNILLKAILRWRVPLDAQKLRLLFERVIDSGYPAPHLDPEVAAAADDAPRQGALRGLPPRTPTSQLRLLMRGLPSPEGPVEFEKHVRPLYKMFLKAFRSRGDWAAAWTVLRILATVKKGKDAE